MVCNQNTSKMIDTGQLKEINRLSTIEKPEIQLEVSKSVQNQGSTTEEMNWYSKTTNENDM